MSQNGKAGTEQKIKDLEQLQILNDSKKMMTWLESGEHYDCTFLVGSTKEKLFKCHRLTLAAKSPALEQILFGHFVEAGKGADDPISMPDVQPPIFEAVLKYFYGRETSGFSESLDKAMAVFEFASKWQVPVLDKVAATMCFSFDFSAEDLLILHHMFSLHSFEEEAKEIMAMICLRGSEVLRSLAIANKDTFLEILSKKK
ncbi:uncharacterized protein LOC132201337 [Neocloeon triangulifer]|uniref:uncharacterized protein LOC132201337 n=1 Tax=Neocloeon triangulifer TaxID=2078957 RepID=UPI00286F39B7|nr:uncharacterized protein LOC132201337 [Neocloeon triangulifer]